MSFDLSDYVDVPERVRLFFEKYPDGSLQTEAVYVNDGWLCTGFAYRTPDDPKPGIGHSYMQVPGTTPYTRDSELENAETSAWGRAIIACGFPSKKIASTEEVLARQPDARTGVSTGSFTDSGAVAAAPEHPVAKAQAAAAAAKEARTPHDDGQPENIVVTFGKKWNGKTLGEAGEGYWRWLTENFEPRNEEQRRIVAAANVLLGNDVFAGSAAAGATFPDDDIPF